ncbi:MAG: hypothetical protein ACRCVU_13830 [Flavobacterium sp.]
MNKFKKGDLVVPSNYALEKDWWNDFDDLQWPKIIRSIDMDGDYYLEDCIGAWNWSLLEHVDEENE